MMPCCATISLLVDGAYATTAGLVTILDAGSGEELDAFFCWYHRISPTGKYVEFVQFYPRFTDPELVSAVLVLYRVADARLRPIRKRVPFEQYPRMDGAGRPIYPEKNYRERSHNWSLDGKQHSFSRVLWFENDARLALVDSVEGKRWLVTVDLRKGLEGLEFAKWQITVPGEAALGLDTGAGLGLKLLNFSEEEAAVAVEVESEADGVKRRLVYAIPSLALKSETVIE